MKVPRDSTKIIVISKCKIYFWGARGGGEGAKDQKVQLSASNSLSYSSVAENLGL